MRKTTAIALLGGTVAAAAKEVGVSASAVSQWPDELPRRIEDRVLASLARKHLPPELLNGAAAQAAPTNVNAAAAALEVSHAR